MRRSVGVPTALSSLPSDNFLATTRSAQPFASMRFTGLLAIIAAVLGAGVVGGVMRQNSLVLTPADSGWFLPSPLTFVAASVSDDTGLPQITHVQAVDLDGEGATTVVACDARGNRILRFDLRDDGAWDESVLIDDVAVPAHATFADVDADGDIDCLVSVLGDIYSVGRSSWPG